MIVPEPDQDLLDALDRRERQPQLAAGLIAIAAAAAVSAVIYELLLHALRLGIQPPAMARGWPLSWLEPRFSWA